MDAKQINLVLIVHPSGRVQGISNSGRVRLLPVSSTSSTVLLLLSRATRTGNLRQSSFLPSPRLRAGRGSSFFWPLKDSRKNVSSSSMISRSSSDWSFSRTPGKRCRQLNDVFRVIPQALAIGRKVVDWVMLSRFHFSGCCNRARGGFLKALNVLLQSLQWYVGVGFEYRTDGYFRSYREVRPDVHRNAALWPAQGY